MTTFFLHQLGTSVVIITYPYDIVSTKMTPKGWPGGQALGLGDLIPHKVLGLKPLSCYHLLWG